MFALFALLVPRRDQVLLNLIPRNTVALALLLPLVDQSLRNAIGHVVLAIDRR